MQTVTVESIEKMKEEFVIAYVEKLLSHEVGIGAKVSLKDSWDYDGDTSKQIKRIELTFMGNLRGHHITALERIFGIDEVEPIIKDERLPTLKFLLNMPKGMNEAFKEYMSAI
jgi:hypothetical protein